VDDLDPAGLALSSVESIVGSDRLALPVDQGLGDQAGHRHPP